MTDIVVLDHKIHGLSAADYADTLQERLPEYEVALATTPAEKSELLREATIATGYEIDEISVEESETLSMFICTFAGTGHLPTETLENNGVIIENASGVHGPNIAEQVLGYILTFVRRLDRAWEQKNRSEWNHFQGGELQGSIATVVGLGPIGQTIVERLNAFDVTTIGVRYTPSKGGPADKVIGFEQKELHEAFANTDFLIIASPLTDTTSGLIDEEVMVLLPTDAMIVNIARGKIIDTDALTKALQTNKLRGAALDVTDPEPLPPGHELWGLQNCLITPHNAGHTPEYWDRCADIVDDALENNNI
jgi:phosphoglycerate dehydrogenase-like enzyme